MLINQSSSRNTSLQPASFHTRGHGLLWYTNMSVAALGIIFERAQTWVEGQCTNSSSVYEIAPDLLSIYATFAESDELLMRIRRLSEKERNEHFVLDGNIDFVKLEDMFTHLSDSLCAWEKNCMNLISETISRQLIERMNEWVKHLEWAEDHSSRPYLEEENELMESVCDFADFRGALECAVNGLMLVQRDGRLRDVDVHAFDRQLKILDERFRRVLGEKRCTASFWTPQSFWWNHFHIL